MKILLISYYYKHKNAMASVRAVKLGKYFSSAGHDVTVLTSNQKDTWTKSYVEPKPDEKIREIYAPEIKRWSFIQGYLARRHARGVAREESAKSAPISQPTQKSRTKKTLKARLRSYLSWLFYFNISKQEDVCMFRGLKKEFLRSSREKYDAVVATYPTYGAFMMGKWLKKHGYCTKLIADFRDPLYNPTFRDRRAEARFDKRCLDSIVKSADKLVCVSEGIADGIKKEYPNRDLTVKIITNGFDPDDVRDSNAEVNFDKSKVNFVYAGALYHGKRCVDMLAEVLKELISDGKIEKDSFAFHYAGSDFPELLSQLDAYGLAYCAVDHGFVPREVSISMQKNATALLLLTWNESGYQGVIPGKLFEYMSVGVPIIALVTGDVPGSEVAALIRETNAGYAMEAAALQGRTAFKQYVESLFNRENKQVSKTDLYSYANISLQYVDFIKEI